MAKSKVGHPHLMQRYVATEILKPFAGSCALFTFLFLMFQILRLSDFLIVHQAPMWIVLKLSVFLVVSILSYVVPVAFLSSVLVGFGRLSGDSELTAMKACGFGMKKITCASLRLGVGASLLTFLITFQIGPAGERAFNEILAKTGSTQVTGVLKEGMFNSGFFDLLLFSERIDAKKGELKNVFIYDDREKNFPMVIVAQYGKIDDLKSPVTLGGQVLLRLFNGHTYQIDPTALTSQVGDFEQYELYLKIDEASGFHFGEPRMMTAWQLVNALRRTPSDTRPYRDFATEIWKRVSLSLSPFFFLFLGIGLGVVKTRAIQSRGVVLTLATVAVYWQSLVYASTQSIDGRWWAPIGMQFPNIVIGLISIFFYRRVLK